MNEPDLNVLEGDTLTDAASNFRNQDFPDIYNSRESNEIQPRNIVLSSGIDKNPKKDERDSDEDSFFSDSDEE